MFASSEIEARPGTILYEPPRAGEAGTGRFIVKGCPHSERGHATVANAEECARIRRVIAGVTA